MAQPVTGALDQALLGAPVGFGLVRPAHSLPLNFQAMAGPGWADALASLVEDGQVRTFAVRKLTARASAQAGP